MTLTVFWIRPWTDAAVPVPFKNNVAPSTGRCGGPDSPLTVRHSITSTLDRLNQLPIAGQITPGRESTHQTTFPDP